MKGRVDVHIRVYGVGMGVCVGIVISFNYVFFKCALIIVWEGQLMCFSG